MSSRLLAVTFDVPNPARVARFWAAVLARDIIDTSLGVLLPGDDKQIGLRFAPAGSRRTSATRMHLHLTSVSDLDQQQTVAKAYQLGARHIDVGQRAEEGHVVCADPGGIEFCVIEPNNAFLAGCGFLGELACDGNREVGLFWSEALGWPLVWDQGQETAIQHRRGGTKVAWGGPQLAPRAAGTAQRLDLACTGRDQASEIERLMSLGASSVRIWRCGRGAGNARRP
jgi:hypothetical protein